MTPKDAIKILEDELDHTRHHLMEKGKDPEYYEELGQFAEAMEKGIAALKIRKTMDDCISRREMLKLAENVSGGYSYIETPTKDFLEQIKSIPPADAQSVWIPTRTLLPNVGEPVLIARKIRHNEMVLVEPAVLRPDGTWKAIGHKIRASSVRHWMPMPEPPKEETE